MVTFDALLTMLLLCAVGFCLRKCRLLDDHLIAKLNRLLVFVASPAMMINASQSVYGGKGKAELEISTFVMPLISLVSFLMILLRIRLPNFSHLPYST